MRHASLRAFVRPSDLRPVAPAGCVPIALAPSTMDILLHFPRALRFAFLHFLGVLRLLPRSFVPTSRETQLPHERNKKKQKRKEIFKTLPRAFLLYFLTRISPRPLIGPVVPTSPGSFPLHRPTKRNWAFCLCLFLQAVLHFLWSCCWLPAVLWLPDSFLPWHPSHVGKNVSITLDPFFRGRIRRQTLQALVPKASNFLLRPPVLVTVGGLASFAPAVFFVVHAFFFSRCSICAFPFSDFLDQKPHTSTLP